MTSEVMNEFDPRHPHEPAEAPILDAEGRCLVCCRMEHDRLRPLLAAERAARETADLMVQKEQRISTELRRTIMDRSRSLDACEASLRFERAAKEAALRANAALHDEYVTMANREAAAIRERDEARRLAEKFEDELREAKEELARREANGNLIEQRDEARAAHTACREILDRCCDAPLKLEIATQLYEKRIAELTRERDEARERLAQVEADAAARLARICQLIRKWERVGSLGYADELHEALGDSGCGKPLLDEVAKMRSALLSLSDDLLADVYPGGRAALTDGA